MRLLNESGQFEIDFNGAPFLVKSGINEFNEDVVRFIVSKAKSWKLDVKMISDDFTIEKALEKSIVKAEKEVEDLKVKKEEISIKKTVKKVIKKVTKKSKK